MESKEDVTGIRNIESFDFSQINNVNQQTIDSLKTLLLRYSVVFDERPNGSKAVEVMEHTIELTDPNVKPIKHYGY